MATWGDYSLRALLKKILVERPVVAFDTQPEDTEGSNVTFVTNVYGGRFRLQRKVDDSWVDVGTAQTTTGRSNNVVLSGVTTTSVCRIEFNAYGTTGGTYSREFTVTRTPAQTQALKENLTSGKLDTDVAETDVVEPTIDKMETEPVAEKTTTTKSK